jgi:hypothetical protein
MMSLARRHKFMAVVFEVTKKDFFHKKSFFIKKTSDNFGVLLSIS